MTKVTPFVTEKKKKSSSERWLVSYADMLTLLFALFLVLFSMSQIQVKQLRLQLEAVTTVLPTVDKPPEPDEFIVQSKVLDIPEGEWFIERRPGVTTLTMGSDGILFASGSAVLESQGHEVLRGLGRVLSDPNLQIRIEGHTDNQPVSTALYPDNWALSVARAAAVARFFITEEQLPPDRIAVMGYGHERPVDSNETAEGRAQNRRVVLVLTHPGEERPKNLTASR